MWILGPGSGGAGGLIITGAIIADIITVGDITAAITAVANHMAAHHNMALHLTAARHTTVHRTAVRHEAEGILVRICRMPVRVGAGQLAGKFN